MSLRCGRIFLKLKTNYLYPSKYFSCCILKDIHAGMEEQEEQLATSLRLKSLKQAAEKVMHKVSHSRLHAHVI